MSTDKGCKNAVDFLDFKKNDVSKATGQPKALEEKLQEIGNTINLVMQHFEGV